MELWDMESGTAVRSVRGHNEDAVTAVKVTMVTLFKVLSTGRFRVSYFLYVSLSSRTTE